MRRPGVSLVTYDFDFPSRVLGGFGWPVRRFDHDDARHEHVLQPGDTVYHGDNGGSGYGTVVGVTPSQATVLWSQEPALGNSYRFGGNARRGFAWWARELIVIQPMPEPKHNIYYFDPDRDAGPAT